MDKAYYLLTDLLIAGCPTRPQGDEVKQSILYYWHIPLSSAKMVKSDVRKNYASYTSLGYLFEGWGQIFGFQNDNYQTRMIGISTCTTNRRNA